VVTAYIAELGKFQLGMVNIRQNTRFDVNILTFSLIAPAGFARFLVRASGSTCHHSFPIQKTGNSINVLFEANEYYESSIK
jgi:hypothetical protein